MTIQLEPTEIPRHPRFGGPYVIPFGKQRSWGNHQCETCKRMVEPDPEHPRKGKCTCKYYKRTTNFIDVIQDEFLLKQWGNRLTAWGVAQRPDLVLAAASCRPDTDDLQTPEDKSHLNEIVSIAKEVAGSRAKAQVGTSLHKLTHQMDRGETLGYVPEPYPADLRVYNETMKTAGIEWVSIESFRVLDNWVDPKCMHYRGHCKCLGVGGTVDRIGWYKGRLRVFDIKTGSMFNEAGHAMQLAMYARMVPYLVATDERTKDVADIDLNIGYIIELPAGKGECRIVPKDIMAGWGACLVAKQVWDIRSMKFDINDNRTGATYKDMALRASSRVELKMLWHNAKDQCCLTSELKQIIRDRVTELDGESA